MNITTQFYKNIYLPNKEVLLKISPLKFSPEADQLLMTIAGQESNWEYRKQISGPARSFWQFESGGGVKGVLNHVSTKKLISDICNELFITCDQTNVYDAMAYNDVLALAMARLLLWTDPKSLPSIGNLPDSWNYYNRNWRPGKPHPETWTLRYNYSLTAINLN